MKEFKFQGVRVRWIQDPQVDWYGINTSVAVLLDCHGFLYTSDRVKSSDFLKELRVEPLLVKSSHFWWVRYWI